MEKYVIITDSTIDMPQSYVNEKNIEVISLKYTLGMNEYLNYLDHREMSSTEFYNELRKGTSSSTSQINSEDVITAYSEYLEKGLDILGIGFSSGLSGTYNSMRIALEDLKEKYPDRQIKIIDSLNASMGEGLFVDCAVKNRDKGMTLEENYESLLKIRPNVYSWFTVSDIDFLKRGGRVSSVSAFLAKTININPVLNVDEKGFLIPRYKKIGRKSALKQLVNEMEKYVSKGEVETVFISHGDCLEDALIVEKMIKEIFDIKEIIINPIGPVIGSHSGPGTVALFFIRNQ